MFNNCPLSPPLRRFLAAEPRLRRRQTRAIVFETSRKERNCGRTRRAWGKGAKVDNKNRRSWQERNTRAGASSWARNRGQWFLLAHFQEWIELNVNPQCGLRRERQCL